MICGGERELSEPVRKEDPPCFQNEEGGDVARSSLGGGEISLGEEGGERRKKRTNIPRERGEKRSRLFPIPTGGECFGESCFFPGEGGEGKRGGEVSL